MKKILSCFALAGIILAMSCGRAEDRHEAPAEKTVPELINSLAFDIRAELGGEDENIFFSPYSIFAAFAMVYPGAAGQTAAEMRRVMGIAPGQDIGPGVKDLELSLNEREREGVFALRAANALWTGSPPAVRPEYIRMAERDFSAHVESLDFSEAAISAARINEWVSEKTSGKIKDLISPGAIDGYTRLVITNAIYFLGAWEKPFMREMTSPGDFFTPGGGAVTVPMMRQESVMGYAEGEGFRALEMNYRDSGVSMVILLPEEKGALSRIEKNLDADAVASLTAGMERRLVRAVIPKFRMETDYDLSAAMKAMGMEAVFNPAEAELPGIGYEPDLHITDAVHKAYVELTEEGTEAAAATGIIAGVTAAPVERAVVFEADHPFVFMIRDTRTGSFLFMGRVADPSAR